MKTVDSVNNFKCCAIEWKNDILLIWKCGLEDLRYKMLCFNKDIIKKKYFFENSDRIQKRFSKIISGTQIKQYNKEKRINIKII